MSSAWVKALRASQDREQSVKLDIPGRCKCGKCMFRLQYRSRLLIRICKQCGEEMIV